MAPAAMNTTAAAAEKEKEKALEDWLPITSSRNAKWWYSAFDNVTAMVGAGVLSLPYAMSELGWSTDVLKGKIIICGILVTICALNVHRRFYTLNAICAAVAVLMGWRGRSTVGAGGGGGGGGRMAAEGARTFNDEITEDVIFSVAFSQAGCIDIKVGSSTVHMPKHCRVKDVIFSVASSQEGGIDIKAGSSTMHMQKHCSVHHPVVQMGLFAIKHVSEDTFCCPHSMVPNAILDIIEKASFCEGAPLNSSGYGEERRDSNIHALGLSQSRAGDGGGSSSTGTLVPPAPRLYLDSGAAHHVVNDDTILINVRDPPARMRIMVADGSKHLVTKVGDIHTQYFKIKDVYHVPQLQMCLVSVGQLTERKIDINFSGNRVELLLEGTRIGHAIIDDTKMYRLLSLQAP